MIDISKLKTDMDVLGKHIKNLKTEMRTRGKNPSWEEAAILQRHKDAATSLYVLRAGIHNKHHIKNKSCEWHNRIIQEMMPKYVIT